MWQIGRILGFSGLLAALVVMAPTDVAAQKKKNNTNNTVDYPVATDANYKGIQKQKEIYGTLVAVNDGSIKSLTLRAQYWHFEANPKYKPPKVTNPKASGYNAVANHQYQMSRTYNDLQVQMQRAATARTPQQAMQAQQRIAQDMARLQQQYIQMYVQMARVSAQQQPKMNPNNMPFITVTNTIDFDLDIEEKVVTRRMALPFEYDDTGNVKTYTDKEKAALRGDDKTKPGYTAKFEDFQVGQEVKLYLKPPVKKEKDKDAEADKDKEKDKDSKEPEEVLRPTVKMMVITKDAPTTDSSSANDKKKKKKN